MAIKAILLDLDGTVYRGAQAITGVADTIATLRKKGLKLFFISNASIRTREEQAEKLRTMGIECETGEVYNTAYVTAVYIKKKYPNAVVYVITEGGLDKELARLGIRMTDTKKAGVVAVGLDFHLTFEKITKAVNAIYSGAVFIASNKDRVYPVENGILPGSGTIVAALEYATGRRSINLGKPNPHMIRMILKEHELKKGEALIVGDNYETDLRAARKLCIKCALVLTGLTKKSDIEKLPKKEKPDFVLESAAELWSILQSNP